MISKIFVPISVSAGMRDVQKQMSLYVTMQYSVRKNGSASETFLAAEIIRSNCLREFFHLVLSCTYFSEKS